MSLIKNLIKEPDVKHNTKKSKNKEGAENDTDDEKKPRPIIKSALDLQRLKLEKLMKNPDKPVIIPEHRKDKDFMQSVPTFVRNVMGSSAGAGSGEFHVYRHLRRKEYARQKMIQSKSHQEQLDDDYQQKLEDNFRTAEEKTAKKRAKRLKKKQRAKKPRNQNSSKDNSKDDEHQSGTSSSDDDQSTEIQENSAAINNDNEERPENVSAGDNLKINKHDPCSRNDQQNTEIPENSAATNEENPDIDENLETDDCNSKAKQLDESKDESAVKETESKSNKNEAIK